MYKVFQFIVLIAFIVAFDACSDNSNPNNSDPNNRNNDTIVKHDTIVQKDTVKKDTIKPVVKPRELDNFTITTSPFQTPINYKYNPSMKMYLVTYKEDCKVTYNWSCSDSKVVGIIISDRANKKPKDGIFYNNDSDYTIFYGKSSNHVIPQWNHSTSTYASYYIWTFDTDRNYSENYYYVSELIPGTRTWTEWKSKI